MAAWRRKIMRWNDASNRVGFALNRPDESTTEDYEAIKKAIKSYPGISRDKIYCFSVNDEEDEPVFELPLFALSSKRVGANWVEHMELLKLIYNAFPDAIERTSHSGMLPLHVACSAGKTLHPRIVMYLLKKYPRAAKLMDVQGVDVQGGWPPLTYYVLHPNPHKTVVKALVEAAPSTLEFQYDLTSERREAVLPGPLVIAMKKDNLSILELLIPTDPSSPVLKLETLHEMGGIEAIITPEKAKVLARGVASWIKVLQMDTSWFTRESFAVFFSTLVDEGSSTLELLDLFISSNLFGDPNARNTFSSFVRQSPKLTGIRARKPKDGSGPSNDDPFFDAIASGMHRDHPLKELGLSCVRGRSLVGLGSIISESNNLTSVALNDAMFTDKGVKSFAGAIRQNNTLEALFLSVCKMPSDGLSKIAEALANSSSVKHLALEPNKEQDLTPLAHLTNIKALSIEMDPHDLPLRLDTSTNAILKLLESSTKLVQLVLEGMHLPAKRLSDILKRNTYLENLKLCGCSGVNKMGAEIVLALRASNGTLRKVELRGKRDQELHPGLVEQLEYYTALNRMGRAKVLQVETATVSDLVDILENMSAARASGVEEYILLTLSYGIMRESPSLWSGEYHDEGGDESSLVQAVGELSLGN